MARSSRGHIQRLPSGSFRVKVYAGTDPVTGKARLLRQTCPDEAVAYAALSRMLVEADGGRFPDQHATLGQALDKYLEVADLEVSTLEAHEGYIRRTIGPVLGQAARRAGPRRVPRAVRGIRPPRGPGRRLPRSRRDHQPRTGRLRDQTPRRLTTRP